MQCMLKKYKVILVTLMVTSYSFISATPLNCESECRDFYGFVGSGYAWSSKAGIVNPDPSFWDPANEGYDNDLGNSPFFNIGFGSRVYRCIYVDVDYTYYQTFHFQKFQTGAGTTPVFTGAARTRFFDLDNQSVLANVALYNCVCLKWCNVAVSPFARGGIGVGINRVGNFHTVGFVEASDMNDNPVGVGSTTSIGNPVTKKSFAWLASAGLRFDFDCSCFGFLIGYRYYDGGKFEGPDAIVANTIDGQGKFVCPVVPWEGRLKTNQIYIGIIFNF